MGLASELFQEEHAQVDSDRLKSESKSYREALNAVRKRMAKHYVENTRMDFSTVSVLLGYAEPSIFFRAFRKW